MHTPLLEAPTALQIEFMLTRVARAAYRPCAQHAVRRSSSPPAEASSDTRPNVAGRKRFYQKVDVVQHAGALNNHFAVRINSHLLRTPLRNVLAVPSETLALAIAHEWDSQLHIIQPHTMPFMKLAATCIDRYPAMRDRVLASLARRVGTDSICFRVNDPARILEMQGRHWGPLLDWFGARFGPLATSTTLSLSHPRATLKALHSYLADLDDWTLCGVDSAASTAKSVVLALALREGFIDAERCVSLARLEEEFQADVWGRIPGGHDMDRTHSEVNLAADSVYFKMLADAASI